MPGDRHPAPPGAPTFPAHAPGFLYTLHRRHEPGLGTRTSASGTIVAAEHSGTHIDALCHQAYDGKLHGGVEVTGSAPPAAPGSATEAGCQSTPR